MLYTSLILKIAPRQFYFDIDDTVSASRREVEVSSCLWLGSESTSCFSLQVNIWRTLPQRR